ncbi:DUF2590 family protein [Spartinivicinus ruber]|uniref:DUF2590 family protein n=1 Tax=Spartinivicinus ruber TaxID=2683272 RepID=UPI0013D75207|nr:DUF2590 family protein [Spartinivicinus ruber]
MNYIDLLIENNDLALTIAGEPQLISDRASIAQDIQHAIRESGLLVEMIGERHPEKRQGLIQQLTLLIEDDERLIPGTIVFHESSQGRYLLTADTYDYGPVEVPDALAL